MRRLIWLSALGCLIPGIVCHAEDDYDIKVYPGARTYDTIIVDGKMTERSWDYAPLAAGFTYYDRPEFVQPQTFLRVIYSPTHLIFGIRCDEPLMDKLTPVAQARDAHAVFSTEAVEFFVDPKHSHGDYFQFAVNAVVSTSLTSPSRPGTRRSRPPRTCRPITGPSSWPSRGPTWAPSPSPARSSGSTSAATG